MARLRLARKRKVRPEAQNSLNREQHSGCLGFMRTEAGARACPRTCRDFMMIDHYAVGAHGTGQPNGSEIERSAIEREKNFCIGVLAIWRALVCRTPRLGMELRP